MDSARYGGAKTSLLEDGISSLPLCVSWPRYQLSEGAGLIPVAGPSMTIACIVLICQAFAEYFCVQCTAILVI